MAIHTNSDYSQGARWFILYNYFLRHCDIDHYVGSKKVIEDLKSDYNISISANTLREDIKILQAEPFNLDIEMDRSARGGAGGYHLLSMPFEPYELKLMIDGINESVFVSEKNAKKITKKIADLGQNIGVRHTTSLAKTRNAKSNTLDALDVVNNAINANKQISITTYSYWMDKGKIISDTGVIKTVNPYAIILHRGQHLLFNSCEIREIDATVEPPALTVKKEYHLLPMDEIQSITVEDSPREGTKEAEQFLKSLKETVLFDELFYYWDMEREPGTLVTLRFEEVATPVIARKFGTEHMFIPLGDNTFSFSAKVLCSESFFKWLEVLDGAVELTGPDWLIQKYNIFKEKAGG